MAQLFSLGIAAASISFAKRIAAVCFCSMLPYDAQREHPCDDIGFMQVQWGLHGVVYKQGQPPCLSDDSDFIFVCR